MQILLSSINKITNSLDELKSTVDLLRSRQSTYIGSGKTLTYLYDDSPFYINSEDYGPPANYLNGGKYEQDYLDLILSFTRDDSIFLDIGANLGFYSIIMGKRVRTAGKVYAFEPNEDICRLFRASAYLNGLSNFYGTDGVIIIHNFGVSDQRDEVNFHVPKYHMGGTSISNTENGTKENNFKITVLPLDEVFGVDFKCDIVKIDVEGHELQVLLGMKNILRNSPEIKIIFEHYNIDKCYCNNLRKFLDCQNLFTYSISEGSSIAQISYDELDNYKGYILASLTPVVQTKGRAKSFSIFPRQLWRGICNNNNSEEKVFTASAKIGELMFHGPYWYLAKGIYEIEIIGEVCGELEISISSNFGYSISRHIVREKNPVFMTSIYQDMINSECAGRALSDDTTISINQIIFTKLA